MRFWPSLVLAVCLFGAASAAVAQAPKIEKIDPPNWWAGLPDPMLLVHGEHLKNAQFILQGKGVTVVRTQASANGHWAFVWLRTANAAPQTLHLTARNADGAVMRDYTLAARSHQANAHRGFSSSDVIYLIMTDRFADGNPSNDQPGYDLSAARGWHGGDFTGIDEHLDYLKQLGITTLWTTPVDSNGAMPESYHGYAATDLYAVDSHFGTLADYRYLSADLHAHGMKLVIDLVPNHIGAQHPWVKDPPTPDWFHGTLQHHRPVSADFYQLVDPHAPPEAWRDVTGGWFTDGMPDLNQGNPLVSRYLIQNAIWWVEVANLDGIRLDTFPYVDRAFWHDFHAELHALYPHLTTVGEIYNRDPEVTSYFAGGVAHKGIDTGLYTPFDFPVCFALRDVLGHDKPMTELAKILRQDALYPHPDRLVPFIGNHDTTRFLTEADGSIPRLKLALGLIVTLRGTPQIYYGDEIGMAGSNDPDNRHDFPGGFPGDKQNAFAAAGRTATQQEVFAWTSGLLALRAAHLALESGIQQDLFVDNNAFAFVRSPGESGCVTPSASERFLVVVNKGKGSETVSLPIDGTALAGCTRFTSTVPASGAAPQITGGKLRIVEPAESMSIYAVH